MTSFDGSGALGLLGINPVVQGSPGELRAQGADLELIASCAPHSPGVLGCSVWKDCRFHLAKMGGFKGNGRRYVGYYLRTPEGSQKQDFIACDGFVKALQARMDHGNILRAQGRAHEIVRVIAQEGETIKQRVGEPVDPNNHTINAPYKMVTHVIVVPGMPRPGDNTQSDYDNDLWKEEMARRATDPEFQTGVPPTMEINETDEPFFEEPDDDSTLDLGVAGVEAAKDGATK